MKRLLKPAMGLLLTFILLLSVSETCTNSVQASTLESPVPQEDQTPGSESPENRSFDHQTLEQLMSLAVHNREKVQQYVTNVEKSKEAIRFAKGAFYPSLDVDYGGNHFNGNSTNAVYDESHRLSAAVTLNVFSGFRDYYNLKAENERQQFEVYQLNAVEQDVKLDVALAFLQVHRAQAYLEVAEKAWRLLEKEHRNALLKYKVGIFKKNDALKIKVQMDDAAQEVNRAKTAVKKSLNDLAQIVAAEMDASGLDFTRFDELPVFQPETAYEPVLLSRRSELNALRSAREAAEMRVQSARSALYPQVDLSTHYYNTNDEYWPAAGDEIEHEFAVQLQVSLNVFDGYRKYADINRARLDVRNAGYDVAELERELKTRLDNILLDVNVALQNLAVAQTSETEAQENLRITQLQFQKGVTTSTEILDAIAFLSRAQFNVIHARTQVFENHFHLTRMIEGFEREIGNAR
jgi:outer membrane protein TolC